MEGEGWGLGYVMDAGGGFSDAARDGVHGGCSALFGLDDGGVSLGGFKGRVNGR